MAIVCKKTLIFIASGLEAIRSGCLQSKTAELQGHTVIQAFSTFRSYYDCSITFVWFRYIVRGRHEAA
jgi:hypothetical protein